MKHIITFFLFFLFAFDILSVPARPIVKDITLSDGTTVQVKLFGDENYHFYRSQDGKKYIEQSDGTWAEQMNTYALTPKRVIKKQPRALLRSAQEIQTKAPISKKFLVLLVEFSDKSFSASGNKAHYDNAISNLANKKSVRNYFKDNSMGSFDPEFVVYGPIKLGNPYGYYGNNDASGNDMHPEQMIEQACKLLDPSVNFSQFDNDHDGILDNIYVIYAGYGEADGGANNTIWPHAGNLAEANVNLIVDGVKVGNYSCSNEINGQSDQVTGIGIVVHEFSHVIGLPDFYDTDYEGGGGQSYGLGEWCVMASGNYNDNGNTPPAYTAIEREMLGWGTATVINSPANLNLKPLNTSNQFFRINTPTPTEYFLLENRQQTGWDTYIPGHGMLIYHIDKTNKTAWDKNEININPTHQYVDIEEANGRESTPTANPFPGTAQKTEFTDTTVPNSITWSNKKTAKPVTDIKEVADQIYFNFMGGIPAINTPQIQQPTQLTSSGFQLTWGAVEGATSYLFNLQKVEKGTDLIKYEYGFSPLPANWKINTSDTYTSAPFIGKASPSIAFKNAAANVITETYAGEVSSVSFTLTSANAAAANRLIFSASVDGNAWTEIVRLPVPADKKQLLDTITVAAYPAMAGKRTFKFGYDKSTGNIGLDDVEVVVGGDKLINLPEYTAKQLSGTQFDVINLLPETQYVYTLKATNGTDISQSATGSITTLSASSITQPTHRFNIYANGEQLVVAGENLLGKQIEVYNAMGQLLHSATLNFAPYTWDMPMNTALFLVKIDGVVYKIIRNY